MWNWRFSRSMHPTTWEQLQIRCKHMIWEKGIGGFSVVRLLYNLYSDHCKPALKLILSVCQLLTPWMSLYFYGKIFLWWLRIYSTSHYFHLSLFMGVIQNLNLKYYLKNFLNILNSTSIMCPSASFKVPIKFLANYWFCLKKPYFCHYWSENLEIKNTIKATLRHANTKT